MTEPAFDQLDEAVGAASILRIDFDRDETDSFQIRLTGLLAERLERKQLFPYLPRGTRWAQAVGWRCFLGAPFGPVDNSFVVGVETVATHPTRGAYPLLRIHV